MAAQVQRDAGYSPTSATRCQNVRKSLIYGSRGQKVGTTSCGAETGVKWALC